MMQTVPVCLILHHDFIERNVFFQSTELVMSKQYSNNVLHAYRFSNKVCLCTVYIPILGIEWLGNTKGGTKENFFALLDTNMRQSRSQQDKSLSYHILEHCIRTKVKIFLTDFLVCN